MSKEWGGGAMVNMSPGLACWEFPTKEISEIVVLDRVFRL